MGVVGWRRVGRLLRRIGVGLRRRLVGVDGVRRGGGFVVRGQAVFVHVDVFSFDHVAFDEGERAFEDIFEFAHVAGEVVVLQFAQGFGGKLGLGVAGVAREFGKQMAREDGDVARGGVVLGIRQAGRVGVVGVFHAEPFGFSVHQLHKAYYSPLR